MPINPFEAISFNEGEPLDIDKLNKLQTNIANTYQTSSNIYNATVGQQTLPYVPVMNCGYVEFTNLKSGVRKSEKFDPGSFSGIPFVVASCRTNLENNQQISVSVINLRTAPEIVCVTNFNYTGTIRIEWIAMEKKFI